MAYGLGVDLGLTYAAAAVRRAGGVELANLGDRSAVVPSVVCVRAGGELISGDAAERRAYQDQAECAREFKRRLGDPTPLILADKEYQPAELLAAQLADIVRTVATIEGEPPVDVVLTCPAVWGPYRREQFAEVAGLAGVPDARMMTEPAAAATHYGATRDLVAGDTMVVYDLGGGTFDVTAVRLGERGLEVLGDPLGIEDLGGVDIDSAVMGYVDDALGGRISRLDPADPAAAVTLTRLRGDCRMAKEALSVDTDIAIPVYLPTGHQVVRLTRSALEDLVRPMLRPTLGALHGTLRSAALTPPDITAILLVGGSSRMPLVRELVGAEFGRPIRTDTHPKHAVALGAATLTRAAVREPALTGTGRRGPTGTTGGAPARPDRTGGSGPTGPERQEDPPPKTSSALRTGLLAVATAVLILTGIIAGFAVVDDRTPQTPTSATTAQSTPTRTTTPRSAQSPTPRSVPTGATTSRSAQSPTPGPTPPAALPPAAGSTRTFRSWKSGLCLGFDKVIPVPSAPLRQQTCGSPTAVAFRLVPAADGAFSLVEPRTGRCVDVAYVTMSDGAQVILWTCDPTAPNQHFRARIVAGAGGRVQLVVEHSGKCLDMKGQDASLGAAVVQWTCHTSAEEVRWRNQSWLAG